LIVRPYAAAAMVLANKIRGIRAVQGASRAAVRAACAEFKANVLIVEQATSTFHEVRTMVQTFAAGLAAMGQTNPLLDAVAELERG